MTDLEVGLTLRTIVAKRYIIEGRWWHPWMGRRLLAV